MTGEVFRATRNRWPASGADRGRMPLQGVPREGGTEMGVKKIGEKYRCEVCGNEVEVTKVGGGTLVCCGKPMALQG